MSERAPSDGQTRLQNLGTITDILLDREPKSDINYQFSSASTRVVVTDKDTGHAKVRELLNSTVESVDFMQYCRELLAFGWEHKR